MAKVKLHKTQLEVANDTHRFRVICAGRRWGKSVLSRLIVLKWAIENPGLYWVVSPTYKQAKQIHWREFKKEIPQDWIAKKPNEVELSLTLKNGSVIELKGAENPDALRGVKLRGLCVDEIASIRNWDWLWQEVLRATLTDYTAPSIFISSPKGFNHFYDLYQKGTDIESTYKSWRFTSYDNPFVPSEEIDQARKELTEATFAQEYLADFRSATGLAHPQFDRNIHILKPFNIPSTWAPSRGFDYGSTHPTASIRARVDPDGNGFIDRSYSRSGTLIEEHARTILSQDYGMGMVPAWGDPSGAQWFMEFARHSLAIQPATHESGTSSWVEFCVEKVNEKLKPVIGHTVRLPDGEIINDAPKLFVLDTAENKPLIDQIENLKWKMLSDNKTTLPSLDEDIDQEKYGHFDLCAALRYWAVSYTGVRRVSAPQQWKKDAWRIGR